MRWMDGFLRPAGWVGGVWVVAVAGGAAVLPAPARAQGEAPGAAPPAPYTALGAVAGVQRRAYRDVDNKALAFPLVLYENRWISVAGPGADLKLPLPGPLSLRLRARYAFDGYEAGDSPYLTGLAERKASVWLGGAALWEAGDTQVSAELLADASGHSQGRQFKLQVERRWQWGDWEVTPRVAATHLDRKWVDYYYGVRPGEARAGRAAYAGRAATQIEGGVRVGYHLGPRQTVFTDLGTVRLGRAVKDSPLAGRSTEAALVVGYLYRF